VPGCTSCLTDPDTICFTSGVSTCYPCSAASGLCAAGSSQLTLPLGNGSSVVETRLATDSTLLVFGGENGASVPATRRVTLFANYAMQSASVLIRPETAASEPLIQSAQQGERACRQ
jgi:hypothetical protein